MPATARKPQQIEVSPETLFGPNAHQVDAWRESLSHRFLLYGGAAGGGKSFFLRWWCVFYLMVLHKFFGVRGAQVILACEDYPTLRDRQIGRIQAEFPPSLGKLSLGETRDFTLAPEYGAGKILLRNLDDPSKYLSSEFAGVAVEELTRNEEQTFHDLRLRMRWPGVPRPCFVGATNPGGKGHGWVKRFWIDRKFPAELQPLAKEFVFVQAKAADNPFLTQSYYDDLGTLPGPMRKAYLEGRWDLFVGQYFNFSLEPHIGKRQGSDIVCHGTVYKLEPWWPRWVSMDWGFKHDSVVYWHTTAPDGRHLTYREWAVSGITPRMLGEGIAERSVQANGSAEKIQQFFLSPDAFADRTGESTIAQLIRDVACRGDRFPLPAEASDDRIGGWQLLYQLLESDQWVIAENCEHLVACLPSLVRDEKKPEDIQKTDGDDPADSARYGLYSRLGRVKAPVEVRAAEVVKNVTDNTARAMILDKFYADEARKNKPVPVGRRHAAKKKFGF